MVTNPSRLFAGASPSEKPPSAGGDYRPGWARFLPRLSEPCGGFFCVSDGAAGFSMSTCPGSYSAAWRSGSLGFLALRRAFAFCPPAPNHYSDSRQHRARSVCKPLCQLPHVSNSFAGMIRFPHVNPNSLRSLSAVRAALSRSPG